ncbi:SdpI family protein [Corynebacterium uberis]|uniref:SdpI family protein n=1 Tax=Corynebacterium TaxID=1716 RepID=UPI001D0A705C|nr:MULTISPECIES: SdpI family protein [Corynebacterium]MCZ9310180.1 SdpI family protein [Corynebacterium sp. c6VSa_13]UDL73318.1 SdpI family protein [Corynebacterium uberis]UDL75804.1 SdpI family protein [Corynebacterium uberis]UDL78017.1 SdpI family protein [Corynebacterium uberis]UDL80299.1 SdpI family protein [Corynebacterium uberis]
MILGVIFCVLAAAVALVGALGWAQRLPGNSLVGLRVPEVRKSQQLWDLGHKIAGPLWVLAGVVFLFAGLFSFIAHGWLWIAPAALFIIALGFIGVGSAQAAHAVAAVDARDMAKQAGGGPAPKVDLGALRRAARASDD